MARCVRWFLGLAILALLVGAPLGYLRYLKANFRNFHVVHEGVLYRSGQLSLNGLKRVVHDYGIKTIVTLRDAHNPGQSAPDAAKEAYCKKQEIKYVRIPPRVWWGPDNTVPAEQGVRTFLEVMDDPANFPVLVHCFAGSHRSGAVCAVYRMEYEGYSNQEALDEMKNYGYANLDDDVDLLWYLDDYRPRKQQQAPMTAEPTEPAEYRPHGIE